MTGTPVLPVPVDPPDPGALAHLQRAADVIRLGGLVAFPTETVYGLGANALDVAAINRIFAAKGRPASDPLIVHIGGAEILPTLTPAAADPVLRALGAAFWPGPLTLIVPRHPAVPANLAAGLPTIAIRMPSHPIALALIRLAGVPIAAPSANRFAHTSPTTAQHVLADLDGRIDLILDGGPTPIGLESTILDISQQPYRLLRPGQVGVEGILAALYTANLPATIVTVERYAAEGETISAPGMLLRHYSPSVPFMLYSGVDQAVRAAIRAEAERRIAAGERVGALVAAEDVSALAWLPGLEVAYAGSLNDLDSVAHGLFAAMRGLEGRGVGVILARDYPPRGIGLAIHDRLIRAAAGQLFRVG